MTGPFSVGTSSSASTATATVPTFPSGLALGVLGKGISVDIGGATAYFPTIAALVTALKTDQDVHILSTPQILTTDNKEAKIIVGKNVPYQTGTTESTVTTTSNYEYRDVGITLKITPHISKDRMVRLDISQEDTELSQASSTQATSTTVPITPTTYKRSIDTTVIVKDNNTVVIGGLIGDNFSKNGTQVPCLGDIPILGWAFRYRKNTDDKTNLFVFITPRVIQSPEEAADVYANKKKEMDSIREGSIQLYEGPKVNLPEKADN